MINQGGGLLAQGPSKELKKRWLSRPSAGSAKRTKYDQAQEILTHGVIELVLILLFIISGYGLANADTGTFRPAGSSPGQPDNKV